MATRPLPEFDGDNLADAALETLASFAVVQFEAARNGPARARGSAGTATDRSPRLARLRSGVRGALHRFGIRPDTAATR